MIKTDKEMENWIFEEVEVRDRLRRIERESCRWIVNNGNIQKSEEKLEKKINFSEI